MKRTVLLFFLTGWSALAYCQCSGIGCFNVQIQEMQVNADTSGMVWVQTSGTETSLNCTPEAGVFLKLDTSSTGGKNVYAALLSVQARGKTADFRMLDNVSPCQIQYIRPW